MWHFLYDMTESIDLNRSFSKFMMSDIMVLKVSFFFYSLISHISDLYFCISKPEFWILFSSVLINFPYFVILKNQPVLIICFSLYLWCQRY